MNTHFKILVPVDFSDLSVQVLYKAAEVAERLGARMMVMHVLDSINGDTFFSGRSRLQSREDLIDLRIEKEKEIEKLLEDKRWRHLVIRSLFTVGVPDREIVEQARRHHASLIIMGTHGKTGRDHFLLGSVAEQVIRKAPCPVLTFNPEVLSAAVKKGECSSLVEAAEEVLR